MKSVLVAALFLLATTGVMATSPPASKVADTAASGSWFDRARDGEGFVVQFIDDASAVVYWFTYTSTGEQRWFTGLGSASGNVLQIDELLMPTGGVFGPGFDSSAIVREDMGELTLTFTSDVSGRADYVINGEAGSQNLERLTRPLEVGAASEPLVPAKSGSWFDPVNDGEGFAVEVLEDGTPLAYWFTYDVAGNQAWMVGIGTGNIGNGSVQLDMVQPVGGLFGDNFDPADVDRQPAGRVNFSLNCDAGFADLDATDADFLDFRLQIQQLVGIGGNVCNDPAIARIMPTVAGKVLLPDNDATDRTNWLLGEVTAGGNTSDAALRDNFAPVWFASFSEEQTREFFADIASLAPQPRLTDVSSATPLTVSGLVTGTNGREVALNLSIDVNSRLINSFSYQNFGFGAGTIVFADDQNLSIEQAADEYASLSASPGLLVARIQNNQCVTVVGRNEDEPRATASIFKIWILAGVAEALNDGSLTRQQLLPVTANDRAPGGPLLDLPIGSAVTLDELSLLMMGISDNTATDILHEAVGRGRLNEIHAEYGHSRPELMAPQLNISEQFHLLFSVSSADAASYVNGTENFQRQFLLDRLVPLGSIATNGGGFFNEPEFVTGTWQASPLDVCGAFARHRQHDPGSDAALVVERALGATPGFPNLYERWDRIWFKGGNLESGASGQMVYTYAWMLERNGEDPYVVVGMANDLEGGLEDEIFNFNSLLSRIMEQL
ncbi:MAG: serine hydrolase [Pseudomonadota bacterium]